MSSILPWWSQRIWRRWYMEGAENFSGSSRLNQLLYKRRPGQRKLNDLKLNREMRCWMEMRKIVVINVSRY